jgi:hypothetical protein
MHFLYYNKNGNIEGLGNEESSEHLNVVIQEKEFTMFISNPSLLKEYSVSNNLLVLKAKFFLPCSKSNFWKAEHTKNEGDLIFEIFTKKVIIALNTKLLSYPFTPTELSRVFPVSIISNTFDNHVLHKVNLTIRDLLVTPHVINLPETHSVSVYTHKIFKSYSLI